MQLPSKILFTFIAAIFSLSLTFASPHTIATADEQPLNIYAYLNQDTTLYSTSSLDKPIVNLPQSYFVCVLGVEQNGFTKVSYNDIDGYIATELLQTVDYEPLTKYETTVKFHVNNDGMKINLRSLPDNSVDSIILAIDADASGYCYGSMSGVALIPAVGDTWHYIKFVDGDTTYRGYVYSAHVIVDFTPQNVIEKVTPPPTPPTEVTTLTKPMSTAVTAAIAATLCVPAAFIMFLLFKRQPKERKPRHGDGWNS